MDKKILGYWLKVSDKAIHRVFFYALPIALLLVTGFLFFSSTGRDDAHITFWPAYTLSHYGDILNYNGQHVEQSSSLLYVLILASLESVIRINIVTLGKLTSIFLGILSIVAAYRLAWKINARSAFPATLFLGTASLFVYWSYSGMEITLLAFVTLILIISCTNFLEKDYFSPAWLTATSVLAFLFLLSRPEAPLILFSVFFCAIVVLGLKALRVKPDRPPGNNLGWSRLMILIAVIAFLSGAIFAFRQSFFGYIFPQPVSAKARIMSMDSVIDAVNYLGTLLLHYGYASLLINIAIILAIVFVAFRYLASTERNIPLLLSILFISAGLAFTICCGGDWMEGGRFLAPYVPLAMILFSLAIVEMVKSGTCRLLLVAMFLLIEIGDIARMAQHYSIGMTAWSGTNILENVDVSGYSWFERNNRENMRDIRAADYLDSLVGKLYEYKQGPVNISSMQMGMVSFYIARDNYGKVRFLGMMGLADRTLTGCSQLEIPRSRTGLVYSYRTYFKDIERWHDDCHLYKPDIIFDLYINSGDYNSNVVEENGYTIVFLQQGRITCDWCNPDQTYVPEFVAIRNELLGPAGISEPTYINYN